MRRLKTVFMIVIAMTIAATPIAHADDSNRDVMTSLLKEVRLLRLTLQQSSLFSLQGDLLVERIRTAQARVSHIQSSLDGVRSTFDSLKQQREHYNDYKENLESKLLKEYDPEAIEALKQQLSQYESGQDALERQTDSLRHRETTLLQQLDEANARLEELEQAFDDLLDDIGRSLKDKEE